MKQLHVADMHCQKCVSRISKALENNGIRFEIRLENKTVSVDEVNVSAAIEILDDLGFSVQETH